MRSRIYSKLAWTNICRNRKTYLPYMVSASGMVMMFFLTINLSMDPQVATFEEGNWMQLILRLGSIVIGLFSVIFLFYTNSFLMKRRKTELGLYHVLGMGKTHIASVLLWETLFTALLSIGAGAIGGMVFSKAAQVLLLRMMGRSIDYVFTLQPSALAYSVILFAAIFALIYGKSVIEISRQSTIDLLYSKAQGEREPRANFVLAFIGILSLGAGYVLAMTVQNPTDAILVFFIAVIAVIIGTYCTFIAGSVALLKLLRKNKNYYYQTGHFIATSSMIFRMKKHGAGLASICILSTMVLVMISSTACLYFGAGNAINAAYPRDLEATIGMRKTNDATFAAAGADLDRLLAASLQKQGLKAKNEIRYTLCAFYGQIEDGVLTPLAEYTADGYTCKVMTAEEYNENFGTHVSLERSQLLYKKNEGSLRETMLTIADKRYAVIGEAKKMILRGTDAVDMANAIYLVVSDRSEFDRVVQALRQSAAAESFRLVNCRALNLTEANGSAASETRISAAEEELQREVLKMQDKPDTAIGSYKGNQPVYASMDMNFRTKGSAMETFTNLYGGLFFLGILLSLAFLGATVIADDQICNFFKHNVPKLRPTHTPGVESLVHTVRDYRGGLYGTVSAHAAISFSIALFTSVLFRRRWYAIAIFVWAALLAYSRIYLGVHYPMDILFGLLLGLSLAAVSVRLCLRRMRRTEEVSPGSSEKDAL